MIASEHMAATQAPPGLHPSWSSLFEHGAGQRLSPNELLYMPEEDSRHVYWIQSGEIRLYKINADGREFTLGIFGAGEIVGESELLTGSPRACYAVARGETRIVSVNRRAFLQQLQHSPETALMLTRFVSFKNQLVERKMESLLFKSAHAKVAEQILTLAEQYGKPVTGPCGGEAVDIAYPITHQEIANLIGATRETVSYVLLDLKAADLIATSRRHVTVCDLAGLKDMARD